MSLLFFIVLWLAAVILQGGNIINAVSIGSMGIGPDILVIFMVFWILRFGHIGGITGCFLLGFGADVIVMPMGVYMISFTVAAAVIANIRKSGLWQSMVFQAIMFFIITIFVYGLSYLIKFLAGYPLGSSVWLRMFGTAGYNMFFGPLLFIILDGCRRFLGIGRGG